MIENFPSKLYVKFHTGTRIKVDMITMNATITTISPKNIAPQMINSPLDPQLQISISLSKTNLTR